MSELSILPLGVLSAKEAGALSKQHHQALNRRRRVIDQHDAMDPRSILGKDVKDWIGFHFGYIDEPGCQIDSVWFDISSASMAVYPSKYRPLLDFPGIQKWHEEGVDIVKTLVEATHQRGLEFFWNERVCEVDFIRNGLEMTKLTPMKAAHPDWLVKSWWWQGNHNLAAAGMREYKVAIMREVAENYEIDGMQIDFARHMPCLPVGRQWELRGHVTEFMRMARAALQETARQRGRPILFSAKVPETLAGCRTDGMDVSAWIDEGLVDILMLGSRTMAVDIEDFRKLVGDRPVKLYPCFDDIHTTDGYHYPPIEFMRGVFGSWWSQGADGVATFNWSNTSREVCQRIGADQYKWGPESHPQAYHEIGDPAIMRRKDKIFAIERRGGYPWSEGHANQNQQAPLPTTLAYDGRNTEFKLRVCDPLKEEEASLSEVVLHVVLFIDKNGFSTEDRIAVSVNEQELPDTEAAYDLQWKDAQILSPDPQPVSGCVYPVNPEQKLLRVSHKVSPALLHQGVNLVGVGSAARAPHCLRPLIVEKVELYAKYKEIK